MKDFIQRYRDYITQKGYNEETVRQYSECLADFARWIKDKSQKTHPKDVTKDDIDSLEKYVYSLKSKRDQTPLSSSMRRKYLSSVKKFYQFLIKRDLVLFDPTVNIEYPKEEDGLPRTVLTRQEVRRLLDTPDISTLLGIRDKAILELFYSTGMRLTELRNIRLMDLDLDQSVVIVKGKFKKYRIVPIGKTAKEYIQFYLENVRPKLMNDKRLTYLFLSKRGRFLQKCTINYFVKGYVKKAGIRKRLVNCHALRHSCATHMLEAGADIRYIQELLGHRSLRTTQIYTRLTITSLKKAHGKFHPREKDHTRKPTLTDSFFHFKS